MPRRHTIRISHCDWDGCPDPAGESGECPRHEAERIRRDGLTVTRPAPYVADPAICECGAVIGEDRLECELCRHPIHDSTEES